MRLKLKKHTVDVWVPTGKYCVDDTNDVYCDCYTEFGKCSQFGCEPSLEDYDNPEESRVIRPSECVERFGIYRDGGL